MRGGGGLRIGLRKPLIELERQKERGGSLDVVVRIHNEREKGVLLLGP